eukprot:2216006-Rhodomonas_salina.1
MFVAFSTGSTIAPGTDTVLCRYQALSGGVPDEALTRKLVQFSRYGPRHLQCDLPVLSQGLRGPGGLLRLFAHRHQPRDER